MLRFYYLIPADGMVEPTTPFFLVGVGESKQAIRDYKKIYDMAKKRQWYFEKVSSQAAEFVGKVAESLNTQMDTFAVLKVNWNRCTVRQAVRLFASCLPGCAQVNHSRNQSRALEYLSLNYRASKRVST